MVQQYPLRLARLKALADKLEAAVDEAPLTVKAQVAAQFRSTLADIAALEGPESGAEVEEVGEVDPVDDIAARRAARRSNSTAAR